MSRQRPANWSLTRIGRKRWPAAWFRVATNGATVPFGATCAWEGSVMKSSVPHEYVQLDQGTWAAFPEPLAVGGITWKLLRVSPEAGTWTAIFECPAGSSFRSHVHTGPGEYFLYKGKMEVRGGDEDGGTTATAPAYGFEPSGARHDRTFFVEDSAFY